MHKTLQDFEDARVEELQPLKHELVNGAGHHGVRSVRTVVNKRYDTPALRIESRTRSVTTSVRDEMDEAGVEILAAFATAEEGNQVLIVGHKDNGAI